MSEETDHDRPAPFGLIPVRCYHCPAANIYKKLPTLAMSRYLTAGTPSLVGCFINSRHSQGFVTGPAKPIVKLSITSAGLKTWQPFTEYLFSSLRYALYCLSPLRPSRQLCRYVNSSTGCHHLSSSNDSFSDVIAVLKPLNPLNHS